MSDDPCYRPNRPAMPLRQPKPGEPIWSLRHDHATWSCELRCYGESWGWEAQILREGELVIGRRFDLRRFAERWAEENESSLGRVVSPRSGILGIFRRRAVTAGK